MTNLLERGDCKFIPIYGKRRISNNLLDVHAGDVSSNENNGQVAGIHQSNQLGPGIQIA